VIRLELSWQQAAGIAGALAAASGVLRYSASRRATGPQPGPNPAPAVPSAADIPHSRRASVAVFTQESALVLGLFALWQYAGSFTLIGPGDALGRSRWIWQFERAIHLPSETAVQRVFLPHPLLIQFFNLYYDTLHFPVLIGCMVWLFVRHRDSYRRWRTTVVAFTGICLLVQLIPVAPPRMLPGSGMVDTAVRYHQSVYSNVAGFDPDQLSAMPSVHVGWAILVAIAVISTTTSRWRWIILGYPAMTTLAVVVTANHFWLDGIVAAMILAAVLAVQTCTRRLLARRPVLEPAVPLDLAVVDDDAERLRQYRSDDRELAGADDGAA
jgi:PAP2 superfamily